MTDRNTQGDQYETPEDVATLYSWANLHGAKYRDFSASRAQTREKARQRMQDAIDADRRRAREDAAAAEAARAAEADRAAEAERAAEITKQTALRQQEFAAQQAARLAAQQLADKLAVQQAAQQSAWQAEVAAQEAAQRAAEKAAQESEQQRAWQQQGRFSAPHAQASPAPPVPSSRPFYPPQPQAFDYPGYTPSSAPRPAPGPPQYAPVYDEGRAPSSPAWGQPDSRETGSRPAWLSAEHRGDMPGPPAPNAAFRQVSEDTLQGSRDRMASRWFALRSVFEGAQAPAETAPAPIPARAPAVAVFSLAGGVGKTSLVATLGRALSARGERVLLIDTAAFGLLPFYFGARDQRPGHVENLQPSRLQRRCTHSNGGHRSGVPRARRCCRAGASHRRDRQIFAGHQPRDRRSGHRFRRNHPQDNAPVAPDSGADGSGYELGGQRQLHRRLLPAQRRPRREAGAALLRAQSVRSLSSAAS